MEIVGKLNSIKYPPVNTHGWYGIVLKPKGIPLWFVRLFISHFKVYDAWMNCNGGYSKEMRWWCYPNGTDDKNDSFGCTPIFWCKIKTYYKVKVIATDNPNPWTWKTVDPQGEYGISK